MSQLRVIGVTSGKGGVGKSHLCANVATLAAQQGQRVLLIDADAGLANLDVLLGVRPKLHLGDLLDGAPLDEVLIHTPPGPWLLPGSSGVQRLTRLSPHERAALLGAWDELSWRFDVIVIDCGPGASSDVLFFSSVASQVVMLVSAEPTSVADAAVLIDALREQTAVREVLVVVNSTRTERNGHTVFARLNAGLEGGAMTLKYLGAVPDDQNVRRATAARKPLVQVAPHSPASRAFDKVAQAILAQPVLAPSGGLQIGLERLLGGHGPQTGVLPLRRVGTS